MFVFLRALFLAVVSGLICQSISAAPALPVVARIHWLGLNQISADTNSVNFMKIWRLPETTTLEKQTLDKLSYWLAGGKTNAASAKLRPLLDDLVTSEFYLEIHAITNVPPAGSGSQPTNQNYQLLLALRLSADRTDLWQTNLAIAVEDLTGTRVVPTKQGWRIHQSQSPDEIEFYHQGEWNMIGLGRSISGLLPKYFASHVSNSKSHSNDWFEADLNISRVADCSTFLNGKDWHGEAGAFGPSTAFHFLSSFANHLHLTMTGQNGNVLSRGTLTLVRPLESPLPDWEIPTNFIHQPLTSITAVRGIAPLLARSPSWNELKIASPPDQAFCWSKLQAGGPIVTYFAAPLVSASNQLFQLSKLLQHKINPWLSTNGQGSFKWDTQLPGLVWSDVFIVSPFLRPVTQGQKQFVAGGFTSFANGDTNQTPDDVKRLQVNTNMVYYEVEQTDVRADADLFLSQLFRLIFKKPQLPAKSASTQWLKKVESLFGDSVTMVSKTGPNRLALERRSTLGLTGLELQFLIDWLDSPTFPKGLHTFAVPPKN